MKWHHRTCCSSTPTSSGPTPWPHTATISSRCPTSTGWPGRASFSTGPTSHSRCARPRARPSSPGSIPTPAGWAPATSILPSRGRLPACRSWSSAATTSAPTTASGTWGTTCIPSTGSTIGSASRTPSIARSTPRAWIPSATAPTTSTWWTRDSSRTRWRRMGSRRSAWGIAPDCPRSTANRLSSPARLRASSAKTNSGLSSSTSVSSSRTSRTSVPATASTIRPRSPCPPTSPTCPPGSRRSSPASSTTSTRSRGSGSRSIRRGTGGA